MELNEENQIIIKTICDFLFFDQYQDSSSFITFEKCFQPLFNNIQISLEKVFKEICGNNKKYITYKRFAKAYIDFMNKKDFSDDSKTFFDLLLNKIIKIKETSIGKAEINTYSYSTKKTSSKRNYISKLQVLINANREIHGITIEYDNVVQCLMYPKNIENELQISLEMVLGAIDEESKVKESIEKYGLNSKSFYQDAITHLFGTLDNEKNVITFLGFKCISGKTVYVGVPKGEGFIFGKFGFKLHDLKIQISEKGIIRLEPGFIGNLRKNILLGNINKVSYKDLEEDELIKEEEYFKNLKDKNDIDKLITTSIIEDDHFFNKKFKDELSGNDYKEVVDQKPRNWIKQTANFMKNEFEKEGEKKLTLIDALNKYDKECEKRKEKNKNLNKYSVNDLTEIKESQNEEEDFDDNEGLILHKTRIFKREKKNQKNEKIGNLNKTMIKSNEKFDFKKKSILFLNKNDYESIQDNLREMINNEIIEKNEKASCIKMKQKFEEEGKDEEENINTKTQIIMKNLKGEVVVLEEDKKSIIEKEKFDKAQKNWKNFTKNLQKMNGIYLFQTMASVIKAKNILKKKLDIPLKEKIELYELLDKNRKIFYFLSQKQIQMKNTEKEEDDILLIPDLYPEKITSLQNLQKDIEQLKELLKNTYLKEEEKKKLEKLLNFYIQQKNIIIENQNKQAKEELIENNNININKYLKEEENKRAKAKEAEQTIIENAMKKRRKDSIRKTTVIGNKSFIARKVSNRIFHQQKMPKPLVSWTDDQFKHEKESLCSCEESEWKFFEGLEEDDIEGWEEYQWCRIDEIKEFEEGYDIFDEGASVNDIKQGDINDCYFLSSIGSLCSYPDFFNKLFHIKEKSDEHVYGIYFFLNGKWKLVLIDDYFPCVIDDYEFKHLCFSSCVESELWVSLLEKAWAKVNGNYARIGCRGFSKEAFDVLTEAYTEQINISLYKEERREELWNIIEKSFKKKYVLTAGTYDAGIVRAVGLDRGHAYTLINAYSVNDKIKLLKLKNPYGESEYSGNWCNNSEKWTPKLKKKCDFNEEDDIYGIFYMSFNDFLHYFDVIDIAKLEPNYHTTYCKINKNQAVKCQIIQLKIDKESPNTFIQLYQKNPRIIRKDGTYHHKVNSFIILADNEFKYIKGASGKEAHLAIEIDLKPGTYYIFSDVNYRNEYKQITNFGYMITFYASYQIKNFENVTHKIDVVSALEVSMYYYCRMKIRDYKEENGLIKYDSKSPNKEIPFRVFCYINTTINPFKVKLNIEEKEPKNFCIYNDLIASEFDNYVIKTINPINACTILIMDYDYNPKNPKEIEEPQILDNNETYENIHPVFNNKGKKLDEKGHLINYYSETKDGKGFTIGLENKSNILYKLKLTLKEIYNIDGDFDMKDNFEFEILPNSKEVMNFRIKPNAKEPKFDFKEIK